MKKLFCLILSLVIMSISVACSPNSSGESSQSSSSSASTATTSDTNGDDQIIIGIAMNNLDSWQTTVLKWYQAACDEYGYKLIYTNAGGNVEQQVNDIESLIVQNPDVIAIQALDTAALTDVATEAYNAGIPIADVYYGLDYENSITVNGGDAYERGHKQGEAVVDFLRKNTDTTLNAGYLWGSMTMDGAKVLYTAFNDAINEATDVKDRFIMLDEQDGEWAADKAMEKTENWVQGYTDMNCILTQNDAMAVGAVSALTSGGYDITNWFVFGDDSTQESAQLIKDGSMVASVAQNLKDTGYFVIQNLAKVAKDELKVGDEVTMENAYTIITAENVESMLDIIPQ